MPRPKLPPFTPGRPVDRLSGEPRVEVHDYGRYPNTLVHTSEEHVDVSFIAPNGRVYKVRLDGNDLRVASLEGGVYVRPKADNVIIVTNLTPFEYDTEAALHG